MNVIVSGLTASGKSTVARDLACFIDYELVSGADARRSFLGLGDYATHPRDYWVASPEALDADSRRLKSETAERDFDRYLVERHETTSAAVFDAWFLAWQARRDSIRIWLEADLDNRVARAHRESELSLPFSTYRDAIRAKDSRSRSYLRSAYGYDLFTDRNPFTIIVRTDRADRSNTLSVLRALVSHALGLSVTPSESLVQDVFDEVCARAPKRVMDEIRGRRD